jgi:hypothetical protein
MPSTEFSRLTPLRDPSVLVGNPSRLCREGFLFEQNFYLTPLAQEKRLMMDSAPCSGTIMPMNSVRKLVPEELAALEKHLDAHGNTLAALAEAVHHDDPEQLDGDANYRQQAIAFWEELREQFEIVTLVGESCLEIYLGYYDQDAGGAYDNLSCNSDGSYFSIGGTHDLTPAGEMFQEHWDEELWTQFG